MAETLGDRIRKARERYGMSQAELSRRVRISKNAMNLIELNKTTDPAVSIVKAVADTLRVSVDSLLGREDEEGERKPATLALAVN
jgi:transcriptional regulator with XRE-family HTH domain